jgi:hypothetical protein
MLWDLVSRDFQVPCSDICERPNQVDCESTCRRAWAQRRLQ